MLTDEWDVDLFYLKLISAGILEMLATINVLLEKLVNGSL